VNHQHPRAPRGLEHAAARRDHGLQRRHVVAERFAKAARLDEIALHVDDESAVDAGSNVNSYGSAAIVFCVMEGSAWSSMARAGALLSDGAARQGDMIRPCVPASGLANPGGGRVLARSGARKCLNAKSPQQSNALRRPSWS
jgi:hypothetical protein